MPEKYNSFTYALAPLYGYNIKEIYEFDNLDIVKNILVKRRKSDNSYEEEWFNISDYDTVKNGISIKISTDDKDFTIGEIKISNIQLSLDNLDRKFDIETKGSSLFFGYIRHNSKIRLETGYSKHMPGTTIKDSVTIPIFIGLMDGRAFKKNDLTVDGNALSLLSIFTKEIANEDLILQNGTVSSIVQSIIDRNNVRKIITYDPDKIIPNNDITVNNISAYNGETLFDVLKNLALLSNSVFGVDSTETFFFKGRDASSDLVYIFTQEDLATDKIEINDGLQRLFTIYKINETGVQAESSQSLIDKYGRVVYEINADSVTDTDVQQNIVNVLRDNFGNKTKEEVQIQIKLMPFINLFDKVRINYEGDLQNPDIAGIWDVDNWDETVFAKYKGSAVFNPRTNYKVIQITHNLEKAYTLLKLREV